MDWISLITTITTIICGGGWFIHYKANKLKAEADAWEAQQHVYQNTIADLEKSCEFIRNDRDLLRKENEELRKENKELRKRIGELDDKIIELQREVARNGRRIEALVNKDKKKSKE